MDRPDTPPGSRFADWQRSATDLRHPAQRLAALLSVVDDRRRVTVRRTAGQLPRFVDRPGRHVPFRYVVASAPRLARSASIVRGWISPHFKCTDIRDVRFRSARSRSAPYSTSPSARKSRQRRRAAASPAAGRSRAAGTATSYRSWLVSGRIQVTPRGSATG